jgi:Xaa-Pro aminopeptidase
MSGGVGIENLHVTEDGCELLTDDPTTWRPE